MSSIMQQWAADLGLRHQGVLVSAIRGCDNVQREDPSKYLVRVYRGAVLRPHCDDLEKCASFMIPYNVKGWDVYAGEFFSSIDHYPNHWILHFTHASHIVAIYHPDPLYRVAFAQFYAKVVKKFHMHGESMEELNRRLNADEVTFKMQQKD